MKPKHLLSFIFLGLFVFAAFTRWQDLNERPLIMTDGQGYYAYLPAVFIYQDLQFNFVGSINEQYYPEDKRAAFVVPTEHGNVNKYFVGTAVMQAPFFVLGCAMSWTLGYPVDGYSMPFQLAIGLAGFVYLLLGTWLLFRLLNRFGFDEWTSAFTALLMVFATNLLYYAVYEPSMSHVYSFFTVSAFLLHARIALREQNHSSVLLAGLALGATVLVRPVNGLILLATPAVSVGLTGFINGVESLFRQPKQIMVSVLVCVAIMCLQPLIYFLQTGSPLVWSYQEEGFNFTSPEIVNVLFSYRKGLFVYSPILLLATLGLFAAWRKRKPGFGEALFVLALVTWGISSWWMWYYGGCYGQRAFIEYLPLFALGLAFLVQRSTVAKVVALLLVGVQLIQTYQYVNHIIPFDNMNKEKYWNLFLRTGDDLAWYYSGYQGQDTYSAVDSTVTTNNLEEQLGWGNEQQRTEQVAYQGSWSSCMTSEDQYGPTFKAPSQNENVNLVRVSGWVRSDSWTTDLAFVCAIEDSTGSSYFWHKRPLRPQFNGRNEWSWVTGLFRCGNPRNATDSFVVYPMKSDGAEVCFDDLEISFITAE